jgi:hypothetical protein
MSQQEQKPQWFWCNKHGDFAVRPICPECEHLGQAFTSSVTPAPPEASQLFRMQSRAEKAEAERDQQAGALVTLREALETLISAVEADGVPGYIYDETKAECGQCGASAPTIAEVKHTDEWCFQRAYEIARAALAASAPKGAK